MPAVSPEAEASAAHARELSQAVTAARADRKDARTRLNLALCLLQAGRLQAARRQALATRRLAGPDWPELRHLGRLLFKLGLFDAAYDSLVEGLRQDVKDAAALRVLSALLLKRENLAGAERALRAAARIEPITPPARFHRGKPTVLRLRSFDNARYAAAQDSAGGTYSCRLRGGHFSIKSFVDKSAVNLYLASVMGDNLQRVAKIPDFDLAINTVSCADLHARTLRKLDRFLADSDPRRVINPPARVLRTSRAENARRLGAIGGIVFPRTELCANEGVPEAVADALLARGFTLPLILRLPGTQTGETVAKVDDRAGLVTYLKASGQGQPVYVIEYIDCSGEAGYFHKTRCFFIDRTFYPVANLSSDVWQIHSGDRYRVMDKVPALQEREKRYLADPRGYLGETVFAGLHAIRDLLKLDFFGIDFTVDRAGRLIVFEANAAMRHNYDHARTFPYTKAYLDRVSGAFHTMVETRCARQE
ncbi:MAG: hypothetical protein RIC87_20150 [Kiloniellales bacterium]